MKLWTIEFTKNSAQVFFGKLRESDARQIVDVWLNNVSQLAGFANRNDIGFFLRELCGMGYWHLPELAPTQEMLDRYKKHKGDWAVYEREFLELMRTREVERTVPKEVIEDGCFLGSEEKQHHCHRRLVASWSFRVRTREEIWSPERVDYFQELCRAQDIRRYESSAIKSCFLILPPSERYSRSPILG